MGFAFFTGGQSDDAGFEEGAGVDSFCLRCGRSGHGAESVQIVVGRFHRFDDPIGLLVVVHLHY